MIQTQQMVHVFSLCNVHEYPEVGSFSFVAFAAFGGRIKETPIIGVRRSYCWEYAKLAKVMGKKPPLKERGN